ncbi:IS1634 family transposase [Candidatus Roizmanbacteria bacterium CG_4_8_14_3_um_filter_35_14]|nr:MAG: IS1634 family transposase [Candidatus Roizmanbacteria bacterium CG_4_8_14_3_um_filter_35_14]
MAFIRKVKTKSGATAVQIAHKVAGQLIKLEHLGSAHSFQELETLISLAKERLRGNQMFLFPNQGNKLQIRLRRSSSSFLFQILNRQYQKLGFSQLEDPDFANLCIARIVEPTSKLDSLRVLTDLGINNLSKDRLYRCLQKVIKKDYRKIISQLCFNHVTSQNLNLVLYDVTTLYFEVQEEDSYRKPGLSKERRLEPQIVIGLLVDQFGFPLGLQSFEGNTAETKTIIPVLEEFQREHHLKKITVVADAAMLSRTNLESLTDNDYHFIVGSRLTKIPYDIAQFQKQKTLTDNQIITTQKGDYRIIYQYREKRARLDIKNIETQIAKAKRMVNGIAPVKRNRFVSLTSERKTLNQSLIDKAYALAGIKGYVTNLNLPPQEIINAYHQLFEVEASFRMAKSDLKARPIFLHKRDAIEAHLTIVFTSLAVSRRIKQLTGVSIKQIVNLLRPIRSGTIVINGSEYSAEPEIPKDIHNLLQKLESGH